MSIPVTIRKVDIKITIKKIKASWGWLLLKVRVQKTALSLGASDECIPDSLVRI